MYSFAIGIASTLASSFFWATAVVLFRKSTDHVTGFGVNVGKNLVGLVFFAFTLGVMGFDRIPYLSLRDVSFLVLSGAIGVGIGDLLFMESLQLLGAGLNAIVGCIYTPLMMIAGVLFFSETLSLQLIVGAFMVVTAIIISSLGDIQQRPKHLVLAILIAVLSMLSTLVGAVLYKDLLHRYDLCFVTWVRLFSGSLFLLLYFLVHPRRHTLLAGLGNLHHWKKLILSGFLGTYLAIGAWAVGLRNLPASLIAVFSELTVIVIILMAYFFLHESLTPRKMAATALAISGALIAVLG